MDSQQKLKAYNLRDIEIIIKSSVSLFVKPHPWSVDLGKLVKDMYLEFGKGVVSFDAAYFGSKILNPSLDTQEFDLFEFLEQHATYLTISTNLEEIEKYGHLQNIEKYNPDTQYLLGVYLYVRCCETGKDEVYTAAVLAPILKEDHRVFSYQLN